VWKVNPKTGEETQVTHPPSGEGDQYASWSFDGDWIVFVRHQAGAGSLWLLAAGGGEARVLLGEPYQDSQPAWSSDSRRLVFSSDRGGQVSLWEIEVASGQLRQLTTGPWDWYPNVASTGRLAFDRFGDRADLFWTPVGGGVEEQLTFSNSDNYAPRFSPDGKEIVFHSNRTGNEEIWLLDVETRAERQLTDHPAADVLPDWSPDTKEIAFFSNREGEFQLWVMEAQGGAPRRLTEQPLSVTGFACTALRIAPRWSPDGEAIGYIAPGAEDMSLWVVDRDGANARSHLSGVLRFDWYRDSRHVVYTAMARDGSGTREMRVADLETGQETTLHQGLNVELTVAPDGGAASYVQAVSHFAQALYVLPLAPAGPPGELPGPHGEPNVLSRGTGNWHVHNGGWSPDGTKITYTRTTDESDLYVIENYE
jgi:TolB protein